MPHLGKILPKLKTGQEKFTHFKNEKAIDLDFNVLDFWKWSVSDLLSNATRGRLAEFIIAKGLGISTEIPRDEWQAYDLITQDGIKIEVKSSAYIQSWFQKEFSKILFSIKHSYAWSSDTNELSKIKLRQADVYIFALLDCKDQDLINPLDLSQWCFFVLSTKTLDKFKPSQSKISLSSLQKLAKSVSYADLRESLASSLN
jgi:hypothetical protein